MRGSAKANTLGNGIGDAQELAQDTAAQIAQNPKKYKLKFKTVEILNNIKEKIGKKKEK